MKKATLLVTVWIFAGFLALLYETPAQAAPIWGSDASLELTGSRTSPAASGVDATCQWDNGGFEIEWDISQVSPTNWDYTYKITINKVERKIKDISHFILEVTNDGNPFNIVDIDGKSEGPQEWSSSSGNPSMPNSIYGVKFDFGSKSNANKDEFGYIEYHIVTDRAPVYGGFYAKNGVDDGGNVVAWNNALNFSDYKINEGLTTTDFIVRPNGAPIPEPATILLMGTGLLGIIGFSRTRLNKKA